MANGYLQNILQLLQELRFYSIEDIILNPNFKYGYFHLDQTTKPFATPKRVLQNCLKDPLRQLRGAIKIENRENWGQPRNAPFSIGEF